MWPPALDVNPVSTVPPRLPRGGVGAKQMEMTRGSSLDAAIGKALLRELVHVDALLQV